jgi:hypothetical protein
MCSRAYTSAAMQLATQCKMRVRAVLVSGFGFMLRTAALSSSFLLCARQLTRSLCLFMCIAAACYCLSLVLQLSSSDNILSINLSELDCDDDEPATSGN